MLNLEYTIPGSSSPELDLSPINNGLAHNASARTFISSALSLENASTLDRILMIRSLSSFLPTTSKQMLRNESAEDTSYPAFARIARVVFIRFSLVI